MNHHPENPCPWVADPNSHIVQIKDIIEFITFEVKKKIDGYFIEKFLSIELMIKEKIICEAMHSNEVFYGVNEKDKK